MALDAGISRPSYKRIGLSPRSLALWVVVGVTVVLVLFPVFMVLQIGFNVSGLGEQTRYGLDNFIYGLDDSRIGPAMWNTVKILVVRSAIGFAVATFVAWLLTRTNIPGAKWLEFGFWVSFFMPTLAVVQGWMFLLEGQTGVLNRWVALLPFVETGPFNIFSFWGIVWAHLMSNNITALYILLSLNFRQMDASLEDAGRICGSTNLGTLRRITVPIMRPIFAMLVVLVIIRGFQSFEIEWILGTPARIDVFGTLLVTFIRDDDPQFGAAAAMATLVLLAVIPLLIFHRFYLGRRHYTTVSSKMSLAKIDLGRWRWPAFGGVLTLVLMLTVVPFVSMVIGSFMRRWGFFELTDPWTLRHWQVALTDSTFIGSLVNTIKLGLVAAVVCTIVLFMVGYLLVRVRFAGRGVLDFVSWLPWGIPGVLLSFGILAMVLNIPALRVFHGTIVTLVLALLLFRFPLSVQLFKTGIMQVNKELEESSQVSGAKWWRTQVRIVIPLLMPMIIAIALMTFISAVNEVSGIILLASPETRTLSLLSLSFLANGDREAAAVITTVIVILGVGLALVGQKMGFRLGDRQV